MGFYLLPKNIGKYIDKSKKAKCKKCKECKNLDIKDNRKLLDHAKQSKNKWTKNFFKKKNSENRGENLWFHW